MNKQLITTALLALAASAAAAQAQSAAATVALEQASARVLTQDLKAPWDMVWGPDDHLWVTERQGKTITRVHPQNGSKQLVATLDEAFVGPQHEGLLGLALAPDFLQRGSRNALYVAYTYKTGEHEYAKIVRLQYDPTTQTASKAHTVIDKLPGSSDHNAGRLRFGPDGKLYYTIGDQGGNQLALLYRPIEAQRLPTAAEVASRDYSAYAGKSLRLNADGSIPADNPVLNGVRSHVFTYGHRNPQGLVFAGNHLFSAEHGPNSDDEVNLLQAGGNYGWPHVAGYQDNQAYTYINHSLSRLRPKEGSPSDVQPEQELDWKGQQIDPLKTFFTVSKHYVYKDEACGRLAYICWPTIAPASIAYYPENGVNAYWRNSLIVSSLKNGALYVLPLNSSKTNIQGDARTYFHTANRYRHTVVSPDGSKLYVATDVSGNVVGKDGRPSNKLDNPGAILEFSLQAR